MGMKYAPRLAEYFREMDQIANRDPIKALKLKHDHLKPFLKGGSVFNTDTPITKPSGISSCFFINNAPPVPFSDDYTGGFTCIDGKVYDDNGNEIDLGDDE